MKTLREFALATALVAALAPPQLAAAPAADPGRDAVRRLADMPTPRAALTATLLADGRVLILGGNEASIRVKASTWMFE